MMKSFAARTTQESHSGVTNVARQEYDDKGTKENVADERTEGSQSENQVTGDATSQQGQQIEHRLRCREQPEGFVGRCYQQYEQDPDGAEEDA